MRNAFSEALYEAASANPEIYIIVADISPAGSMQKFQEEYPERFINVGVAEQVMTGMAAGLALKGKQPFTYTIATFTLYRPFEMVRDDLCYQNMPVTIVGMGAGVVYSGLGGTHQTLEDVAIASAVPNMRVIAPCDPLELRAVVDYCATQREGPIYLRIGKAGEPVLSADALEPWEFGKLRYLKRGDDTCILTYGPITARAFALAERLEAERGQSVSIVSAHTIKPLDGAGVAEALRRHAQVVVLEEHVPHGGLSSRVKEIAWDSNASCRLHCFTLGDCFRHFYGSYDELLDENGLSIERMFATVTTDTGNIA